jgi:rusticyanin
MTFRVAGLTNPTIIVPQGAQVRVELVNADNDTSHAWLLTPTAPPFPYMAMMGTPAAFAGSLAPPLGESSGAGMPSETISFTAATPGRYTYLCPVPGHAQRGMYGTFVVARG